MERFVLSNQRAFHLVQGPSLGSFLHKFAFDGVLVEFANVKSVRPHRRRKAVDRRRVEGDLGEILRVGFVPRGRLEVLGCWESVSEDLIP